MSTSESASPDSPAKLLTPSKIAAWLECDHYLTLSLQPRGQVRQSVFGEMAQMLLDKGLQHEADCLQHYIDEGLDVLKIADRPREQAFGEWNDEVHLDGPLNGDHDVVFQLPLIHQGIRGIADFVLRVVDPETGVVSWEPLDAKLARKEAKVAHVIQLCFYADAIEELTGVAPENIHIWLGSGRIETIRLAEVRPYWHRLRDRLLTTFANHSPEAPTVPEPCDHCGFCEFAPTCDAQWRSEDSLVFVAGLRAKDRRELVEQGVTTLDDLASLDRPLEVIDPSRLGVLTEQAALQRSAREAGDETLPPPFRIFDVPEQEAEVRGFLALPPPSKGDVFLDYEGHPFWRADRGLFFLFGLWLHDGSEWIFDQRWAHDEAAEGLAVESLINDIAARLEQFPDMHVYHYNHTERSELRVLAAEHRVGEDQLEELVSAGVFVDLFQIIRHGLLAGVESYGLKYTERLAEYERGHDIDQGAGAVVAYDSWANSEPSKRDLHVLEQIAAYNEDDVRATKALYDWLLNHRPADAEWRVPDIAEEDDKYAEINATVEQLLAAGTGDALLLAELLGYWKREGRAAKVDQLMRLGLETGSQMDDPKMIAGLEFVGEFERFGKTGKLLASGRRQFTFPPQPIGTKLADGANVICRATEGNRCFLEVCDVDVDARTIDIVWNKNAADLGGHPSVVVLNDHVRPDPKPAALSAVADPLLAGQRTVATDLLQGAAPRFRPARAAGELRPQDLDGLCAIVGHLDDSFIAIQGPPGTGKTYTGAHLVLALVEQGKRVGITGPSHAAIDNLLAEVLEVAGDTGRSQMIDPLRKVKAGDDPTGGPLEGVATTKDNKAVAKSEANVITGTTWLFANADVAENPVDVLLIDEAGQVSLADALATTRSAKNLVLLGDPQQLPQVAQATHPEGSDASVLQHVIGADRATIELHRGAFLHESRRMHPSICGFISDVVYESKLASHVSCHQQDTSIGTGLRYLEAGHEGCTTSSAEEAELIKSEVARLIGESWIDQEGKTAAITADDIIVVAPYNDQVQLVRSVLESDRATADVRVGTVDKFQGQEAVVVFFTMATSSVVDMPRGPDFLFSKNRLNVAISRARCLAYLICTPELLNSTAKDVEMMKLLSALCALEAAAVEPAAAA